MIHQEPILDQRRRLVLRAALGEGAAAVEAYRDWRSTVPLDDVNDITYRLLPALFQTAETYGLQDKDTPRIRGVIKHIWLSNILRVRALSEALAALEGAGIDALLLKGAALFARDERFAALHVAGDYDIQVRPADARRAISTLIHAAFKPHVTRADLFATPDFEQIHAAHFVKGSSKGSLDLHWRPLPQLHDPEFVDNLFTHSETAEFAGRRVKIPCSTDHLFLTVARPEPWEANEVLLRAIEATQILRNCKNTLDWGRFENLVSHYRQGTRVASMLRLIQDELHIALPDRIIERLWSGPACFNSKEQAIRRTPPYRRGGLQTLTLRIIEIAKSERSAPKTCLAAAIALLRHRHLRTQVFAAIYDQLAGMRRPNLAAIWQDQASRETTFDSRKPSFRRGFSLPDEDGRWTDGKVALLALPVDVPLDTIVRVRFVVFPFIPPGLKQFCCRITSGIGAVRQQVFTYDEGTAIEMVLRARAVGRTARKVVIAFELTDAGRPIALGLSDDPRLLGLLVRSVEALQT